MATLVLSTVGSALGGPIGGALGSLVGGSIDGMLFGGARKGPRLGDLQVQTSAYGSAIPRIYGTMRVAGTVIWAPPLHEEQAIEGGGKGSPERLAYHYSASFAVALSSRPIVAVRRIWADGKLIRRVAGDFKVKTTFRVHRGDEAQAIDPLIASIEGIDGTPAYRGVALAVFEELDLGEFGNRIPMLTFEVVADEDIRIGELLRDLSGGQIESDDARPLPGFAAYGESIGDGLTELIDLTGVQLTERDGSFRTPEQRPMGELTAQEMGSAAGERPKIALERQRAPDSGMPTSLTMTFHDPDRDYQAGQVASSSGNMATKVERIELPAVLRTCQAKTMVEEALARRWRSGERMKVSLPPSRMDLRPGDAVKLAQSSQNWVVRSVEIDAFAVTVELEAVLPGAPSLPADPGRATIPRDEPIGRTELVIFELPSAEAAPASRPAVFVAGATAGDWKPVPIALTLGAASPINAALNRRAIVGRATTVLAPGSSMLLDCEGSVTVRLVDATAVLLNADDDALMSGANLALLGSELIQFARAQQLAPGTFRLSQLLRGRRGTEWAAATHSPDEPFCMIDFTALQRIDVPVEAIGGQIRAVANGIGDVAPLPFAQWKLTGEAMSPPAPCHLSARSIGEGIEIMWIARSLAGWAWIDGISDPGGPGTGAFLITIDGPLGRIELQSPTTSINAAADSIPGRRGDLLRVAVSAVDGAVASHEISTTLTF